VVVVVREPDGSDGGGFRRRVGGLRCLVVGRCVHWGARREGERRGAEGCRGESMGV
jgi:hypothetical protein